MKKNNQFNIRKQLGFTLIEVMLVMVLIGLIVSAVTFNPLNNRPEDQLEDASARFTGIFNVAAEYGLLNNIELGIVVKKNGYKFVAYNGSEWQEIPAQDTPSSVDLPEQLELTLELEDLPIEGGNDLFDAKSFFDKEDDFRGEEKKKEKIVPQIFVLSGGDFTSFKLIFSIKEEFQEETTVEYHVIGLFTLPLKIMGPIYDEQDYDLDYEELTYEG